MVEHDSEEGKRLEEDEWLNLIYNLILLSIAIFSPLAFTSTILAFAIIIIIRFCITFMIMIIFVMTMTITDIQINTICAIKRKKKVANFYPFPELISLSPECGRIPWYFLNKVFNRSNLLLFITFIWYKTCLISYGSMSI